MKLLFKNWLTLPLLILAIINLHFLLDLNTKIRNLTFVYGRDIEEQYLLDRTLQTEINLFTKKHQH